MAESLAIIRPVMLRKLQEKMGHKTQFVVTAAMLLLLPLLAALQYRWLGQLSAGEREQMKNHLRGVANRFSQDFDQEIARVYAAFMPDRENFEREKSVDYAANYDQWLKTSPYPGLIKGVFLVEQSAEATQPLGENLPLACLNTHSRQIESCDWPQEMAEVREQLEIFTNDFHQNAAPSSNPPAPPPRFRLRPTINEKLATLIMPLMKPMKLKEGRMMTFSGPQGFVIITLDPQYIRHELLPALVKRHFIESGERQYDLAITSQQSPPQVFYQSSWTDSAGTDAPVSIATANWNVSHADISVPIFSPRFGLMRQFMRDRHVSTEHPGSEHPSTEVKIVNGGEPPDAIPFFSPAGPPPMNEASGIWQLHLRHHSGSVEAAVASVRRRNLLISFGILALLGGSVALMLLSSRRARRLAEQQMDFVAGISHELRTPLAVIDSAAYNLDKGVVKDPQQIKSYGALIRKETARLTGMVEQVLEFAGVQSGKQRYDLLPTGINHVIDEVLVSARSLLVEGDFQIDATVANDLPTVLADPQALARAIHNLLNNAVKYSGESRWIGLRADAPSDKQVRITISDRGIGIPDEDLPHIFEPFYRGREARAAQIHGNGLGLSLVKNIITAHGGQITVKSKAGEGSTFTITLPAVVEAAQAAVLGAQLPTAN